MRGSIRGRPNSRYGFLRQSAWVVFNASAMLALAACGGGGGGGGDDPPAPPVQNPPANTAPTVAAGADQTIQLPTNSVQLTGSAQDADNNTLTYAWTADPGTVTFSSTTTAATTATFPGAGIYTLTLTVNDGTAAPVADALTVTVEAAAGAGNVAPTVTAGDDQTIQLPTNTAALQGSATDDGLPANSTLTYAWTSSPAGVTFTDAAAASTTATFPAAGTYTLTLTASDGALSGTDALVVVVQAAAGPVNVAPIVDAGADQSITLSDTATLQGTATDDGLPSTTLTYQWTVAGSAAGATIADPAAASTTATFTAEGAYELILTASDGELTGTDSLIVNVGSDFYPALDTDAGPDHGWTRVTPAEVGMDAALLGDASTYASTAGGAGMVVKGGRLVHSWAIGEVGTPPANRPVTIDTRFASQSATKSIGGMALGLAIDEGRINLTDRARILLPTFGQPPNTNDPAQLDTITILQLATHTAGFEKERKSGDDLGHLIYTPGTTFFYSDGGLNWLADVLTTVLNRDLRDVLTERVWSHLGVNPAGPLALDDVQWRPNDSHVTPLNGVVSRELASGITINANAMARVGLLYLRNGVWSNGRILSEDFIATSRTPRLDASIANPDPEQEFPGAPTNYGVLWWTNRTCQLTNVPADAYWAWGQYDSLIVVIPSLDLVISRIGPTQDPVDDERVFGEGDWSAEYAVLSPFLGPIVAATGATGTICVP